jgi:glyoxylase-like metal-dependent hydrolase (beta-lactamase superfamily II)
MPPHPLDQYLQPTHTTLGNFELTLLSDGNYYLDGGALFGVVPKVMWSKRMEADELNRIAVGMNSLLVRTAEHNVLIETGAGNKLSEKQRAIYHNSARLLGSFAGAGIAPDEIDVVINTHLHFDHCGWNTVRQGERIVPTFPRAMYYVQQGELEHAHEQLERDRVSYLTDNYDPLVESGKMKLLRGAQEIVPGIRVEVFPGHTRDLQAVIITSGGKTACYASDLIPTTAHLDPTWTLGFDLYPLQTIESRKLLYRCALPEDWLLVYTHDPRVPWSHVAELRPGKYEARVENAK